MAAAIIGDRVLLLLSFRENSFSSYPPRTALPYPPDNGIRSGDIKKMLVILRVRANCVSMRLARGNRTKPDKSADLSSDSISHVSCVVEEIGKISVSFLLLLLPLLPSFFLFSFSFSIREIARELRSRAVLYWKKFTKWFEPILGRLVPRACTQVRACDYAVLFENWSSSQRDKFVVKQARTSSGPLSFHALFDCASLCHKITR